MERHGVVRRSEAVTGPHTALFRERGSGRGAVAQGVALQRMAARGLSHRIRSRVRQRGADWRC